MKWKSTKKADVEIKRLKDENKDDEMRVSYSTFLWPNNTAVDNL